MAWCDLFYICRLPFHKVYTTEKTALYWFHFRSFFNSLHKPFLLSDKKKHGPEKKMPLWHFATNYFSRSRFLCYLTANACNSRVLRLQNEFPYLNENYQTDERDTFHYVFDMIWFDPHIKYIARVSYVTRPKNLVRLLNDFCYNNKKILIKSLFILINNRSAEPKGAAGINRWSAM